MIAVKVSVNGDLRRFTFDSNSSLETLVSKIRQLYAIPQNEIIVVHYEDDEKDRITIGSDAELREAINLHTNMSKSTQQPTLRLFVDVKPFHQINHQPQRTESSPLPKTTTPLTASQEEPASFINFAQTMGFNNSNFNQLFTPLLPQYLTLLNNVHTQQNTSNANTNNKQANFSQLLMNPQLFSLFGQFIGSMPREQMFAVMHQLLANPVLAQATSQMLANFAALAQQAQTQQNSAQQPAPEPNQPVPEVLNAAFVDDATFPDGSVVQPLQDFVKIWKLKNNGNTTWPKGVKLDYVSGELQATLIEPLNEEVPPGAVADVKITFKAPNVPGKYSSFWKMSSPTSGQFGASVWVDIVVAEKKPEPQPVPQPTSVPQPVPVTTPQYPPSVQQPASPPQQSQTLQNDDAIKYAKALTQLNEMGFHDDRLNLRLLLECDGELLRVVQELLNLEIGK
mmetsp:Transcript_15321/g.21369  ORF Transcript_15321/g.21369 Transcript_15321/m.21369 type:complete len:452 (-) Transcript_15321:39-1394(-)